MSRVAIGSVELWIVIVILGIGTFGMRLSFIHLYASIDAFSPRVRQAMTYIPAAVLSALIFPALFPWGTPLSALLLNARSVAGVIAAVVAWRTRSMMATIGVGMGSLWGLRFLGL